jgi:pimeloyl-ACP methyl ester carboxylesterase
MAQHGGLSDLLSPFRIDVRQIDLDDLHLSLSRTRWPDELPGVGWSYGVPLDYVKSLAEYWQSDYDWRTWESRLNAYPQVTTTIDGASVHLMHVRSPEPDALPLIMTLGWPSSISELLEVIGPLTDPRSYGGEPSDAFHLVAPSIPGFGFSGPTCDRGWDARRVARAWTELMRRLGYERYGAQGGDWGAIISPELGRIDGGHVVGVHVNAASAGFMPPLPVPDHEFATLSQAEKARVERLARFTSESLGYAQIQGTRPQTLAFALTDSPVGQLAWIVDLYRAFKQAPGEQDLTPDQILTTVSIYWLTGTAGSSARLYRESAASAWSKPQPSTVPTGVAVFPGDSAIRRYAEEANTIVHWSEFDRGGHYPALQAPDLFVSDIRTFFRRLR